MLDRRSVLKRADDVRFRAIGDETVVVRQDAAEALVLNEVAGRILELIDGRADLGAVIERLATEYAVDHAELENDVRSYASELVDVGLAQPIDDQD